MKHAILCGLAISALLVAAPLSVASAADMAVKAPPPPPPMFNWTGFYIGGFAGGAVADRDASASEPRSAAGAFYNGPGSLNTAYGLGGSFIGGGTIGYNWQQPGSNFVLGIEGEAGYLHLRGSRQDVNAFNNGLALSDSVDSTRIGDAYGVIAGRAGWSADRALFYVKGGVAFVASSSSFNDSCIGAGAPGCGPGALITSHSDTQVTYAVGAGVEYAFNNNWSIKGEYLYLGTQKTDTQTGIVTAGGATGTLFTNSNSDPGVHTGKIGINYRWGGPVVAKY
jgi:outer membrane immunogenic protein